MGYYVVWEEYPDDEPTLEDPEILGEDLECYMMILDYIDSKFSENIAIKYRRWAAGAQSNGKKKLAARNKKLIKK
jgi:hypothetical protein